MTPPRSSSASAPNGTSGSWRSRRSRSAHGRTGDPSPARSPAAPPPPGGGPTRGTSQRRATRRWTEGIHFALSTPGVHTFCTPGDIALLPRVLASAERYRPLDDDQRHAAVEAMAAEDLIFPMPR